MNEIMVPRRGAPAKPATPEIVRRLVDGLEPAISFATQAAAVLNDGIHSRSTGNTNAQDIRAHMSAGQARRLIALLPGLEAVAKAKNDLEHSLTGTLTEKAARALIAILMKGYSRKPDEGSAALADVITHCLLNATETSFTGERKPTPFSPAVVAAAIEQAWLANSPYPPNGGQLVALCQQERRRMTTAARRLAMLEEAHAALLEVLSTADEAVDA